MVSDFQKKIDIHNSNIFTIFCAVPPVGATSATSGATSGVTSATSEYFRVFWKSVLQLSDKAVSLRNNLDYG